jgi:dCMP deaminase
MNDRMKKFYMTVAEDCAKMSRAVRLQVGSVIVKNNNIISFSWNGMPAGWDNNCEDVEWMSIDAGGWLGPEEIEEGWPHCGTYLDIDGVEMESRYRLKTKPEVLHAEANAVAKVARSPESSEGAVLFVTHAPCLDCAKLIYQSGISSVYYRNSYRDKSGVEFLTKSNIDVTQIIT